MGSIFDRYRTWLILTLLLLYALAQIFAVSAQNRHELNWLERSIIAITSPPQKALTFVIDKSHQMWLGYVYLTDTRKNYKELLQRHRKTVLALGELREVNKENERLRTLLALKESLTLDMVAARVISFGSSSFTHSVRIDKGLADGIREGMPVVTYEGVVGHIINATKHYANVLLLIDPSSSVDVLNQTSRARGIVQGKGTYDLKLDYLTHQADLKTGDLLTTSGLDALYPKGLTVGSITAREDDPAKLFVAVSVHPSVNFSRLEEVLVITNPKPVFKDNKKTSTN